MGGVLSEACVEDCWSLRCDDVVECKGAGDALQHGVFLACQQSRLYNIQTPVEHNNCRALPLMPSSFCAGYVSGTRAVLYCTVRHSKHNGVSASIIDTRLTDSSSAQIAGTDHE